MKIDVYVFAFLLLSVHIITSMQIKCHRLIPDGFEGVGFVGILVGKDDGSEDEEGLPGIGG